MRSACRVVVRSTQRICIRALIGIIVPAALYGQSSPPQGNWSTKAPLPLKVSEVALAAAGGKIYVIGGSTSDTAALTLNEEYDPASNQWRERAPLPRPLTHAAAVGLNGKIYVVGAFTAAGHGDATDSAFEYDPAADMWRDLPRLKSPRGSVGLTTLDGKLHAIGGRGKDKVTVATHEVYDPARGKWT
jgi:N-acetylneuraminic acid mutarotase